MYITYVYVSHTIMNASAHPTSTEII
uniref:Uncharacterized protein n=1 Tax=Amphimedon queenslandica TaxID=400682 RepID=A0A1X7SE82_AMPQE